MGIGKVVTSLEWKAIAVPDVYFSFEYYSASALLEPDFSRIVLLKWEDEEGIAYLPLILRAIPGTDYFDATSAYGYGGPWKEGSPDIKSFLEFFNRWAIQSRVVCTFLRFHPLIKNAELLSGVIPLKAIGPTAGWRLEKPRDLVAGMAKGHRKTLRKAIRSGVEARIVHNPSSIEDFILLYKTSMNRLSANEFYNFSDTYWENLRDSLGKDSLLVEAVLEDQVIAAVWCLRSDNFLHFHLSGTSNEGRALGGSVLCRVSAAEWAQENGLSLGHFGGGVGGADSSLLTWKQKFDESALLFEFFTANIIHDESLFSTLSMSSLQDGFFPPWRNPKIQHPFPAE